MRTPRMAFIHKCAKAFADPFSRRQTRQTALNSPFFYLFFFLFFSSCFMFCLRSHPMINYSMSNLEEKQNAFWCHFATDTQMWKEFECWMIAYLFGQKKMKRKFIFNWSGSMAHRWCTASLDVVLSFLVHSRWFTRRKWPGDRILFAFVFVYIYSAVLVWSINAIVYWYWCWLHCCDAIHINRFLSIFIFINCRFASINAYILYGGCTILYYSNQCIIPPLWPPKQYCQTLSFHFDEITI